MIIENLRLLTNQFQELKKFYTRVLCLPLLNETKTSFTIQAGHSTLTFEKTSSDMENPFYHFAFDIPGNKIDAAMDWLRGLGIELQLLPNNSHQIYSTTWHATSIYFYDPAENIVEFIERHTLANTAEEQEVFTNKHILNISEIGLVVHDVHATMDLLKEELNVETYKKSYDSFAAVGDEEGLFILSAYDRVWLGSNKKGDIFQTEVKIKGAQPRTIALEHYPYQIVATL